MPRVLLIEDDEDQRNMLGMILRKSGLTVVLAESAQDGLRCLAGESFDIVLTDYRLPVMDGIEFTMNVRRTAGPNQRVPIALLTAGDSERDAEAVKAGVAVILRKEDVRGLGDVVRNLLGN